MHIKQLLLVRQAGVGWRDDQASNVLGYNSNMTCVCQVPRHARFGGISSVPFGTSQLFFHAGLPTAHPRPTLTRTSMMYEIGRAAASQRTPLQDHTNIQVLQSNEQRRLVSCKVQMPVGGNPLCVPLVI